jgi:hypothetical protein
MVPRPASGIRRVTLSVGGYAYTSEVWRESETSWTLLKVHVHKIGVIGSIDFHGVSCLEVLRQGEVVALEIISLSVGHASSKQAPASG